MTPQLYPVPDPWGPEHDFFTCCNLVEVDEGGYSDDPNDHGGATLHGVTQKTYDAYRTAIGQPHRPVLQMTDNEELQIYYSWYWRAWGCDQLALPLAFALFQCCVNMAPRWVQACRDLGHDYQTFLAAQADIYRRLAQQPGQMKWLQGWLKRIQKTQDQCAKFAADANL